MQKELYQSIYFKFLCAAFAVLLAIGCAAPLEAPLLLQTNQVATSTVQSGETPTISPPLPTFSSSEAGSEIVGLISNNGGCEPPCILGLTIGNIEYARKFFMQFPARFYLSENGREISGSWLSKKEFFSFIFAEYLDGKQTNLTLTVYLEGDQVTRIAFGMQNFEDISQFSTRPLFGNEQFLLLTEEYSPNNLLSKLGRPSEVLLIFSRPAPDVPLTWQPATLGFIFGENEVVVQYILEQQQSGDNYSFCLPLYTEFDFSYGNGLSLRQAVQGFGNNGLSEGTLSEALQLEAATDLSVDELMDAIQTGQEVCLLSPIDLWGY